MTQLCHAGVYTAVVAFYLPGLPLIMGAGFVFGCAPACAASPSRGWPRAQGGSRPERLVQVLEGPAGRVGRRRHWPGLRLHACQASFPSQHKACGSALKACAGSHACAALLARQLVPLSGADGGPLTCSLPVHLSIEHLPGL